MNFKKDGRNKRGAVCDVNPDDVKVLVEKLIKIVKDLLK
jgi:hypothetical protein